MLTRLFENVFSRRKANVAEKYFKGFPFVFSKIDTAGGQSVSHIYASPRIDALNVGALALKLGSRCWSLDTDCLKAVYMEVDDLSFLIFQPRSLGLSEREDLIDSLDQSIDSILSIQLKDRARELSLTRLENMDHGVFSAIILLYHHIVGMTCNISVEALNERKTVNTHLKMLGNYRKLSDSEPVDVATHVENFSTMYFIEIYAIGKLFQDSDGLTLHDVATNTAHFPVLVNSLNIAEGLKTNIARIECSDLCLELPHRTIDLLSKTCEIDLSEIKLSRLDLFNVNPSEIDSDIVTANDILEHFNDEDSLQIFKRLWSITKSMLIVHVPFEAEPHREYGHLTTFNKDKLTDWANCLDRCTNVTSIVRGLFAGRVPPLYFDQFLFLRKDAE
ncbi:hypothetical protein [Teredinibacter purpureus]|uniref:hypothetical protein n=1 Tax=Teredinibacter purpureus TaxID=2731756 RepID=UPI0005F7CF8C|nr:hypothetical protein [Teredinibacter purpureus]